MFKPADPTRRMPSWLQNHTKENFIWQLAMTAVVLGGFAVKDKYDEWKFEQKLKSIDN